MSRLDEIKARAEQVHWTSTSIEQAMARMASSAADVPWLLAEVARLTAERDALWTGTDPTPVEPGVVATDAQSLHHMLGQSPENRLNNFALMRHYALIGADCAARGDEWEIGQLKAERDALAAKVAHLAEPGDPDARMDAYYYGFTRTGIGLVDNILSAVAKAGKSYHGTDMWGEELIEGGTCESRIQDAAEAAAEQIRDALAGSEADTSDTQPADQEDQS